MKESVPNSDVRKMAKMEKDQVIGVLIQILKKSRKWRNGERSRFTLKSFGMTSHD